MAWLRLKVVYGNEHALHRDPSGLHVERPERLERALEGLTHLLNQGYASIIGLPEPDESSALLVHEDYYVELIRRESTRGFHYIDADTYVNEHTYRVALAYATASREAALKAVESSEPWLILPRPPGHHAGRAGRALGALTNGFCIFNHVAVAAKTLVDRGYKVVVIDFDAHHGNGTQDIFWDDPRVVHVDIHQEGIYPGTGDVEDIGGGGAEGTKVNVPLPSGAGDGMFTWILEYLVKPLVETIKPDFILVSAGFDSHKDDVMSTLMFTEEGYCGYARYIHELMVERRVKNTITVLEGGYTDSLRKGVRAYTEALLGMRDCATLKPQKPPERVLRELGRIMSRYWGLNLDNS